MQRANPSPTSLASVSWFVTFSEAVTGVDLTDFALVNAGLTGAVALSAISGSGASYTVTAATGTGGTGTLGLNLVNNGTIKDAANQALTGSFTGQVYSVTHAISTSVLINPGTNIQGVVNLYPAGTTFLLKAGIHRLQTIQPRDGDIYLGEVGTILRGSQVLSGFAPVGDSCAPAPYYAIGQTQEGTRNLFASHSYCLSALPRCDYPEDLWFNGTRKVAAGAITNLAAGQWFFDYVADRIYVYDDPFGITVETSVNAQAFMGTARNVQIRGPLIIEEYATPIGMGAISGGTGWTIDGVEIRQCHGAAIFLSNSWIVRNCSLHDNGEAGHDLDAILHLSATGCTRTNNTFSGNGWAGLNSSWVDP